MNKADIVEIVQEFRSALFEEPTEEQQIAAVAAGTLARLRRAGHTVLVTERGGLHVCGVADVELATLADCYEAGIVELLRCEADADSRS